MNHDISHQPIASIMPLRPFPLSLNVGTDIASIGRMRKIIDRDRSDPKYLIGLLKRILTRRERIQFWNRYATFDLRNDIAAKKVCEFLAGRYVLRYMYLPPAMLEGAKSPSISTFSIISAVRLSVILTDRRPGLLPKKPLSKLSPA